MPGVFVFGLFAIVLGLVFWTVSAPLSSVAARSRSYSKPSANQEPFRRRTIIWIRTLGSLQIVLGLVFLIYGAFGGR